MSACRTAPRWCRPQNVIDQVGQLTRKADGVSDVIELSGFSLISGTQEPNGGAVIAILKPWGQRTSAATQVQGIINTLQKQFNAIPSANITAFIPPAIPGLGNTGGFDFELEGRQGQSSPEMAATARALIYAANQNKSLASVFTSFSAAVPEVLVRVNTAQAELLGVSPADIYTDDAGRSRLPVRELFQFAEPGVPGDRAGRIAVPQTRSPISTSCTSAASPARWCR